MRHEREGQALFVRNSMFIYNILHQFRLLSARWSTYTTNFASRCRAKIYVLLLSSRLCKNGRQIKWIMFVHNFCLIFYFENDSIKLKKAIAYYSSDASSLSWNASSNPAFRMRIILSLSSSVMRDMAFSSDSSILSLKTFFSTSVRPSR